MAELKWDQDGARLYETGVRKVVLYVDGSTGTKYGKGVAWNGVTNIDENPTGAEATPLFANDSKYLNLTSVEEYEGTITAYTYPDEFAECDGSKSVLAGMTIGQQPRKEFGYCYRTAIGNDVDGVEHGYKLHLVYGALAAPSSKSHASINNDPEATEMSWDITTTPVPVKINGVTYRPTSVIEIDSTKLDEETKTHLAKLEEVLYGSSSKEARLPLPEEVYNILSTGNESEPVAS